MQRRAPVVSWVVSLLALLVPPLPRASAQQESPAAEPSGTNEALTEAASEPPPAENVEIRIFVIGTDREFELTKGAVAEWRLGSPKVSWFRLPRFERDALFENPSESSGALVRCWIDLSDVRKLRLYFANGTTQRFLVRTLETKGALDEMDREALGQTVELSLLALLRDRDAGLSREATESLIELPPRPPPPPPIEKPPAKPRRRSETHWDLGAYYGIAPRFSERPFAHGPGVVVARTLAEEPSIALWAQAQYQFAQTWRAELAGLALQGTSIRVGAELRPLLFRWGDSTQSERLQNAQALALRLGGGADIIRIAPRRGNETELVALTDARAHVEAAFTLSVESYTTLASWISLRAGPFVELSPSATSYEVQADGEQQVVFETWRVRPGVLVGANFSFY